MAQPRNSTPSRAASSRPRLPPFTGLKACPAVAHGLNLHSDRMKPISLRTVRVLIFGLLLLCAGCSSKSKQAPMPKRIPVIFDTDIGDDIDDTWALGFLLRSPELDLKLAVGDNGKAEYRARLLAKFLEQAGRSDVPVGIGLPVQRKGGQRQAGWLAGYELKQYPGKVEKDGVKAIIKTIMNSPQPVTLICVGPVQNIAEALKREPRIAQNSRFVGMHGSVRFGYGGTNKPVAEYNVKEQPKACQAAFTAPWAMT